MFLQWAIPIRCLSTGWLLLRSFELRTCLTCLPSLSSILALLISDESVWCHIQRTRGDHQYAIDTEELRAVFSSEEMSDPRAQLLLLEFLREQERDVIQGNGRASGRDGM